MKPGRKNQLFKYETRSSNLESAKTMLAEALELTQGAINCLAGAIEFPEIIQLAGQDDVQKYAIEIIHSLKGKVIVTGVGKSAHIGNKLSATLTSTGTPSYFVHATEASHGDLGSISKKDLLILLKLINKKKKIKIY